MASQPFFGGGNTSGGRGRPKGAMGVGITARVSRKVRSILLVAGYSRNVEGTMCGWSKEYCASATSSKTATDRFWLEKDIVQEVLDHVKCRPSRGSPVHGHEGSWTAGKPFLGNGNEPIKEWKTTRAGLRYEVVEGAGQREPIGNGSTNSFEPFPGGVGHHIGCPGPYEMVPKWFREDAMEASWTAKGSLVEVVEGAVGIPTTPRWAVEDTVEASRTVWNSLIATAVLPAVPSPLRRKRLRSYESSSSGDNAKVVSAAT
ncbi:hypothetical protein M378DRAFT_17169 [Amanita muscaria Koide BX008]|uniref:Uncharacterized protein n=1 Tax=Amanita muscaria (strain Koide BX008) TaxID=946122 RepID=A0A0C2S114_AMAMK|nr:hypothetical protein M378DRAFT_17169 [Amanita muscaria Koide BX008]